MEAIDSDYCPPWKKRKLCCPEEGDRVSLSSLPPDIIPKLLTILKGSAPSIRGYLSYDSELMDLILLVCF